MANQFSAQAVISPSYIEPGLILPYTQASGAFETVADGEPLPRLSEGDLMVYATRVDLRTKVVAGQSAANELPSCSIAAGRISTPTYLLRVRAEYDHHDTAAAGRYGISIAQAQTLAMRQGHFQLARAALLFGFNPAGGEGLMNTQGATAVSLPADSNGNTTVVTYDNGQMALFLLGVIQSLLVRTNQLGQAQKITILGPQRILSLLQIVNIVQVTSYQRPGAGTASTAEVVNVQLAGAGCEVSWVFDDTLIGKGAGGSDAIIVNMPEVKKPVVQNRIDTNVFAGLAPGLNATAVMYCDMAAPREIPTPLPFGAIDVGSEWRISSGWVLRPEAITLVSMVFQ